MVGQPRPARRVTSRSSTAAPPYAGASSTRYGSWAKVKSPSRNSATSGDRKNSAIAGATRRMTTPHRTVGDADIVAPGDGDHLRRLSPVGTDKCRHRRPEER